MKEDTARTKVIKEIINDFRFIHKRTPTRKEIKETLDSMTWTWQIKEDRVKGLSPDTAIAFFIFIITLLTALIFCGTAVWVALYILNQPL